MIHTHIILYLYIKSIIINNKTECYRYVICSIFYIGCISFECSTCLKLTKCYQISYNAHCYVRLVRSPQISLNIQQITKTCVARIKYHVQEQNDKSLGDHGRATLQIFYRVSQLSGLLFSTFVSMTVEGLR